LGTNTLTVSFTGPSVAGGILPAGNYRLTFRGNGLIGNGRAVDAANTATPTGSNFTFDFTQPAVPVEPADFDSDLDVDGFDFLAWQRGFGTPAPTAVKADGDADGDQDVDSADFDQWVDGFGGGAAVAAVAPIGEPFSQLSGNWFVAISAPGTASTADAAALAEPAAESFAAVNGKDSAFAALEPARSSYRPAARQAGYDVPELDDLRVEDELVDELFAALAG
jgi:hypothetical protein